MRNQQDEWNEELDRRRAGVQAGEWINTRQRVNSRSYLLLVLLLVAAFMLFGMVFILACLVQFWLTHAG
jgi:maltodextrin utilization protein YvdJ